MKTIDTLIQELVKIGRKYPGTSDSITLFKNHTNQIQARYLKNLETIDSDHFAEQCKSVIVKHVIKKIYEELKKEGSLIRNIHQCIMQAEYSDIFKDYVKKHKEIVTSIKDNNEFIRNNDDGGGKFGYQKIESNMSFQISSYQAMAKAIVCEEKNPYPDVFSTAPITGEYVAFDIEL